MKTVRVILVIFSELEKRQKSQHLVVKDVTDMPILCVYKFRLLDVNG